MAEKRERTRIENIKDTTANWERANPILLNGEIGIEVKPNKQVAMKIGDGITHWKDLDYVNSLTVKEIETLLSKKVDKIEGMGLSQNNYSDEEKAKLSALGNGVNFKGCLDSIEQLPSTATVGDMYFVSGENSTTLCCVYSEKKEWETFTVFSVDLSDYIKWDNLDSKLSETSSNPIMNKTVALKIKEVDERFVQTEDKVTNNILKIADNTAEIEQIRTNVTATGTAVVLEDLQGGVPFSKIEVQDINLLYNTLTSRKYNGITYTKNDDGSISLSGTATGDSWFVLVNKTLTLNKGNYIFGYDGTLFTDGITDSYYYLIRYYSTGNHWYTIGKGKDIKNVTLTVTEDNTPISLGIRVVTGDTVDCTIYPYLNVAESGLTEYVSPIIGKEIILDVYGENDSYTKTFTPTESPFILTENLEQYEGTNTLMVSAGELSVTGVKKNSALKNVWEEFDENKRQATALDIRLTQTEDKVTNNIQSISNIQKDIEDNYYDKSYINTEFNDVNTDISKKYSELSAGLNGISGAVTQNAEDIEALESVQKVTNTDIYARIRENTSNIAINKITLGYQKKNLLKQLYPLGHTHSNSAKTVTWIFNSDYSISMTVTTKLTSGQAFEYSNITLKPGTYIYSVEGYSTPNIVHTQLYVNGAWSANLSAVENTITVTEEAIYSFRLYRNASVTAGITETLFPMLRHADITDDTFEPYVKSVKERFESQSLLYSNTTGGSSPLNVTVSNMFAEYLAVICNITTSSGNYSIVLPLGYVKSLGTSTYYEAEGLLFYYVDDSTITIRTGLAQSNPTISSVKIIGLY